MQQPSFWTVKLTIEERFTRFHATNPEVYALFAKFARELRSAGVKRYGAKGIMERIRWHCALETGKESGYTINDHFTSRYVRMLIEDDPSFEGFFELRSIRTA